MSKSIQSSLAILGRPLLHSNLRKLAMHASRTRYPNGKAEKLLYFSTSRAMRSVLQLVSLLSNLETNQSATPLVTIPWNASENYIIKQLLTDYDWRVRPNGFNVTLKNGGPVVISVNILLRTISKIDDVNMEYSTQFTFRESWNDERLAYRSAFKWEVPDSMPSFVLLTPGDPTQQIWMPDTFFQNERSAQRHMIDKPNILIRIYPNGDILYSIRLSLVFSCPMSLKMYPLDRQTCLIDLASYAYTSEDILYEWKEDAPIQLKDTVRSSLPNFRLISTETIACSSKTATGDYSCLRVDLHFQRMLSYYLLQFYAPSFMLVVISWMSFWVDQSSVPARVALGVTTLLTITTQASGINQKLPPVSYVKAIDVWIGVCLLFVFGALLEFALVNYAANHIKKRREPIQDNHSQATKTKHCPDEILSTQPSPSPELAVNEFGGLQTSSPLHSFQHEGHNDPFLPVSVFCIPTSRKSDNRRRRDPFQRLRSFCGRVKNYFRKVYQTAEKSKKIDIAARFIFPLSFFIFNTIYWFVYL